MWQSPEIHWTASAAGVTIESLSSAQLSNEGWAWEALRPACVVQGILARGSLQVSSVIGLWCLKPPRAMHPAH